MSIFSDLLPLQQLGPSNAHVGPCVSPRFFEKFQTSETVDERFFRDREHTSYLHLFPHIATCSAHMTFTQSKQGRKSQNYAVPGLQVWDIVGADAFARTACPASQGWGLLLLQK